MTDLAQPPIFAKLLANEVRWQLVSVLTHSDYRVQELVRLLNQPQNLVSYHLKLLRDSQVVHERRSTADARDIYYSLDLDRLRVLYSAAGEALHPILGNTEGAFPDGIMQRTVKVLFLCTENSARSQMAEGLLQHIGNPHIEGFSAGTAPAPIHPNAIKALAAVGIDISQQRSKSIIEFQSQPFDYVITVCDRAREHCPALGEGTRLIHWSLPDPAMVSPVDDAQYRAFVQTANELTTRIQYLIVFILHQKAATR